MARDKAYLKAEKKMIVACIPVKCSANQSGLASLRFTACSTNWIPRRIGWGFTALPLTRAITAGFVNITMRHGNQIFLM